MFYNMSQFNAIYIQGRKISLILRHECRFHVDDTNPVFTEAIIRKPRRECDGESSSSSSQQPARSLQRNSVTFKLEAHIHQAQRQRRSGHTILPLEVSPEFHYYVQKQNASCRGYMYFYIAPTIQICCRMTSPCVGNWQHHFEIQTT